MESRRYISLAFWAKERHEHSQDEITNVISLSSLLEATIDDDVDLDGQASHFATSFDDAA